MNKIPTIFIRDRNRQPALVAPEWHPDRLWVRDGEGIATRMYDGTSCLVRDGKLYKRHELLPGDEAPPDFESLGTDENTGRSVGWIPVGDSLEDCWHREALNSATTMLPDGTYELLGPTIRGNNERHNAHVLQAHNLAYAYDFAPREFESLRRWLSERDIEGLVWHHDDGRMAKIKRRDFGLKW